MYKADLYLNKHSMDESVVIKMVPTPRNWKFMNLVHVLILSHLSVWYRNLYANISI